MSLSVNRDGQIRILSEDGVLVPYNGSLFYPGKLSPDLSYPQLIPKKITALATYRHQTVYLDDKQVFSNAWAGKLQINHGLPRAKLFAGRDDFNFLVSDGETIFYLNQSGERIWSGSFKGLLQISYFENLSGRNYF